MNKPIWQVFPDPASVAQAACQHILHAAAQAIAQRGAFRLVLAGGSTPELTYRLLAKAPAAWTHWHIYYSDERCLPPQHSERNSQKAQQAWLTQVSIPTTQHHAIPAEKGANIAAQHYAQTIQTALPFDLVLLGMGEDGHTASLFPEHKLQTQQLTQAVFNAPKPPPERVSLSLNALQQCAEILLLISGASKREAVKAWRAGKTLPVAQVAAAANTRVLIDAVANLGVANRKT